MPLIAPRFLKTMTRNLSSFLSLDLSDRGCLRPNRAACPQTLDQDKTNGRRTGCLGRTIKVLTSGEWADMARFKITGTPRDDVGAKSCVDKIFYGYSLEPG